MKKNRLWRRNIAILLLVVFSLLIAGCWNRRELKDLGIVGMIGIERAGSGVKVTVELIKPERRGGMKGGARAGGGGAAKKPVVYIQAEGETIFDAFRNATLRSDSRFFHAHNRAFVFSEDIAKQGLASQMDVIFRDHEFREHVPMVVAIDASSAEVMGIAAGVESVPSKYLNSMVMGSRTSSKAAFIRVIDFMQMYKGQGKNAVVGILRKVKKDKITPKDTDYELDEEGVAVFKKDKLVGLLDGEETRGYNWVTGNVKTAAFVSQASDSQRTTVEVFSAESKLEVTLTEGGPKLKVKISVPATVMEETGAVNVNDPAVVAMLEASTAETVRQEAARALIKAQEYRSDIFGFGQAVHRKYPKDWKKIQKEWDELFATAESEISVEVNIIRIGKATKPVSGSSGK